MIRTSPQAAPRSPATPFPNGPGSLLGSIALIAGTTIGAGILALPAVTQSTGAIPATVALIGTWLYMIASGFLLVEVHANLAPAKPAVRVAPTPESTAIHSPTRGVLAMARQTLGRSGAIAAGLAYSFLHYALLVAYLARGGEILQTAANHLIGRIGLAFPFWSGPCIFALGFGGLLFWGSQRTVARINSLLLAGAIAAFFIPIVFCLPQVSPDRLLVAHWGAIVRPIPTLLVALVFHNTIPTVSAQLDGNVPRIRRAILIGSLIPLVMFAIWNVVILGSADPGAPTFDPLARLATASPTPLLPGSILLFSGLAIATSFIGFVYGLLEFYADLWPTGGWRAFACVSLPPLVFALAIPEAFFSALDYAGIFGITLLFGILPAAMAWQQRHLRDALNATATNELAVRPFCPPLLPGGRWSLGGMMLVAIAIILQQLVVRAGAFFFS